MSIEIKGRNLIEGIPKTIVVSDEEIREAMADSVATIINAVRVALERTPPELSADISRSRHRPDGWRSDAQEVRCQTHAGDRPSGFDG